MPNFKYYDYNQTLLLAVNLEDQLQPGTFEHAIHYIIDNKLDLSIFNANYKNDKEGRPAYDPAILLKIILFAYSKGITSTRDIQWCCRTNIVFKALSCDTVPHFTTIANFVSRQSIKMQDIFEQVLLVCHEQGLLGNELIAIDGCKMPSNAAKEHSGTFKELDEKRTKIKKLLEHHIEKHKAIDKEDSDKAETAARTQQAIDTLNKAHDRIDKFLNENEPRIGKAKTQKEVKSNITDNESCKMKCSKGVIQGYNGVAAVDKKHQIIVNAQAYGEGQEYHTLQPVIEGIEDTYKRIGISEDIIGTSIIITADTGFANEENMEYLNVNNINAFIPDTNFRKRDPRFEDQKKKHPRKRDSKSSTIIPASEFDYDPVNKTCICPAGEKMRIHRDGKNQRGIETISFSILKNKCRDCKLIKQCMRKPESASKKDGRGRQVSFVVDKKSKKPTFTDWMKERVDSDRGKEIYGHRMSVVEPVFGNLESNKKLNRFSLRGKTKVQGQWQMFCMIQNIEKLANYGKLVG